eukprot:5459821-Amphidinium_carterae.1
MREVLHSQQSSSRGSKAVSYSEDRSTETQKQESHRSTKLPQVIGDHHVSWRGFSSMAATSIVQVAPQSRGTKLGTGRWSKAVESLTGWNRMDCYAVLAKAQ